MVDRAGQKLIDRPVDQPAYILKFTDRVKKTLTGSISDPYIIKKSNFSCINTATRPQREILLGNTNTENYSQLGKDKKRSSPYLAWTPN